MRGRVVLVAGPTASGKSALAVDLARRVGGEVINADSRQIYGELTIGVGRPRPEEMGGVPHHLFGVASLDARWTAHDYGRRARQLVDELLHAGRRPIVCGGTGLYLRALLGGLANLASDPDLRRRLEERLASEGRRSLYDDLVAMDPDYARRIGPNDPVRLVRALEIAALTGRPPSDHYRQGLRRSTVPWSYRYVVIDRPREVLDERIRRRVRAMAEAGVLEEVGQLVAAAAAGGDDTHRSLGYDHWIAALRGEVPLEEAIDRVATSHRKYARRQRTWFRKEPEAEWHILATEDDRRRLLDSLAAWLEAGS